jgi:DNA-directed RNA polymerase specialized sigma24 family protein
MDQEFDAASPDSSGWAAALVPDFTQGLTERAWTMLRLIYFGGLSQREVATRLRMTAAEVSAEVAHSLQIISGIVLAPS